MALLGMLPGLVHASVTEYLPQGAPVILLASSGGLDSQVLVHAAAAAWPSGNLVIAHVHHGLQSQADDWLRFCADSAARIGLRFLARRLPPLPQQLQGGIEAWARRRRYDALAEMAAEAGASCVLTAHHANDQLETHQLRLLRGAGPLGLGAMRRDAPLPGAPHRLLLRPFLTVDRALILAYAQENGLEWVEDPSNQDLRFARNRIRRDMTQALLQDPGRMQRGLAEIDGFQQVADRARQQARSDLAASRLVLAASPDGLGRAVPPAGLSLSRAALARLPSERLAEAVRLWLQDQGCRMPSQAALAEMLRQLIHAGSTHARLRHDGQWLLRYRDRIDVATDLPEPIAPVWFRWAGEPLLAIGGQQFHFRHGTVEGDGGIVAAKLAGAELLMDQARSADRLRLAAGAHLRSWKNLIQERGIAPWVRGALPVLRQGDKLLHAGPFGMNHEAGPEPGGRIVIEWLAPAGTARWL